MLKERLSGLIRPVLIVAGVLLLPVMILIPLPTPLLDSLMALNLAFAILVLITTLYSRKNIDISLLPTCILVFSIFSLFIQIACARLILTQGEAFDGKMVRTFSAFAVSSGGLDGLIVGFIIFISIMLVLLLVIIRGAVRASEVAARFCHDSLPGKQMAIDAKYNSGVIDDKEAAMQKGALHKECDFYGALDGAGKFIHGAAKAWITIFAVCFIGVIILCKGITLYGETITDGVSLKITIHCEPLIGAMQTHMPLLIGNSLVSQLPVFLISIAMGIVVTRAARSGGGGSFV